MVQYFYTFLPKTLLFVPLYPYSGQHSIIFYSPNPYFLTSIHQIGYFINYYYILKNETSRILPEMRVFIILLYILWHYLCLFYYYLSQKCSSHTISCPSTCLRNTLRVIRPLHGKILRIFPYSIRTPACQPCPFVPHFVKNFVFDETSLFWPFSYPLPSQ